MQMKQLKIGFLLKFKFKKNLFKLMNTLLFQNTYNSTVTAVWQSDSKEVF